MDANPTTNAQGTKRWPGVFRQRPRKNLGLFSVASAGRPSSVSVVTSIGGNVDGMSKLDVMTLFVDRAFSARLELAEADHLAGAAETYGAMAPEAAPTLLRVGGGVAAFFAPNIQISRAVGLGMRGAVSAAELDGLEAFYRGRAPAVRILVSAHADPTLYALLGARGFRLVELDTVLVRAIGPAERFADAAAVTRLARDDEAAAWVRTSLSGFSDRDEPPPPGGHAPIYERLFTMPSVTYLFGLVDGVARASAAVDVQRSTAHLFATSTMPVARRRGLQGALIEARLALAQQAGCDLAFLHTAAGSPSQRNAERHGFRPVASRASMIKPFAP